MTQSKYEELYHRYTLGKCKKFEEKPNNILFKGALNEQFI